jgi:hypothetical protein
MFVKKEVTQIEKDLFLKNIEEDKWQGIKEIIDKTCFGYYRSKQILDILIFEHKIEAFQKKRTTKYRKVKQLIV